MDTENLQRYLDSFGKQVVKDANGILSSQKGSTALSKSIRFEVEKDSQGFTTKFYMLDYGTFVDKGVSGNKIKRGYINTEGFAASTPYSYKSKQPPANILAKWVAKKGLKGRDKKTGRYISNMSLAFLIARKIKRDGIQGISFFSKAIRNKVWRVKN